jgi:hypothetical protein
MRPAWNPMRWSRVRRTTKCACGIRYDEDMWRGLHQIKRKQARLEGDQDEVHNACIETRACSCGQPMSVTVFKGAA